MERRSTPAPATARRRYLCTALALGALSACAATSLESRGIENRLADSTTSAVPWTARVLLVADTQTQTTFGRSFFERSSLADRVIHTSLRSPYVDEFADSLLLQACAAAGPTGPTIHLGDAANTSCEDELESAFAAMNRCRYPSQWAFVPGNHEGFLMGNTDDLCDPAEWNLACYGSVPLTKDRVVKRLEERAQRQGWEPEGGKWGDALEEGPQCPEGGKWWRRQGTLGALVVESAACLQEAIDRRYQSYFVQLARLPAPARPAGRTTSEVYAILLDTTQYEARPALLPLNENAGMVGSVLDSQWRIVRTWVQQRSANPIVLIGHHRIKELTAKARAVLLTLVSENPNVVLYISAHTHSEAFYEHDLPGPTQDKLVEMNVASVLDFPNTYRDFQILQDGARVLLSTRLSPSSLDRSEDVPRCEPGWLPDDDDFFPFSESADLGGLRLDVMLLRARATILQRLFEKVGLSDKVRERWVLEQLRSALAAAEVSENTWRKLREAILQARAAESLETPQGIEWLRNCRVLSKADRNATGDPLLLNRVLACERHEFRRCVALRGARLEKCTTPCRSIPEQGFRPRSDDLVLLRRWEGALGQ